MSRIQERGVHRIKQLIDSGARHVVRDGQIFFYCAECGKEFIVANDDADASFIFHASVCMDTQEVVKKIDRLIAEGKKDEAVAYAKSRMKPKTIQPK